MPEIQKMHALERKAIKLSRDELSKIGLALLFIIGAGAYSLHIVGAVHATDFLVFATVVGAFMALNIGANDVANNVGPAVGSKALTLGGAIAIAAIFEGMGAVVAGGDVVKTVKKGIIDPSLISDPQVFIWAMAAALAAASLWLAYSTYRGNPVSTTHSIVGGVAGAGIAAAGWAVVSWGTMGKIAASWVISPVLGGIIAALFLFGIKKTVLLKGDVLPAARRWVPVFVAVMAWAFGTYIMLKGVKHLIKVDFTTAALIGVGFAVLGYLVTKWNIVRRIQSGVSNDREGVNTFFTIPLIFAAALLSFAHGANDVANAVGPLAGIYESIATGTVATKAGIPMWIMLVGAIGIAVGLMLFGPKLIRTVGTEITELDRSRAFCIALSAAITVIIASQLGLPVSSTHIALGGVFGVGFLREWLRDKEDERIIQTKTDAIKEHKQEIEKHQAAIDSITDADEIKKKDAQSLLDHIKSREEQAALLEADVAERKMARKHKLVRRDALYRIGVAWVVTVPIAGALSAGLYYMLRGMLL